MQSLGETIVFYKAYCQEVKGGATDHQQMQNLFK